MLAFGKSAHLRTDFRIKYKPNKETVKGGNYFNKKLQNSCDLCVSPDRNCVRVKTILASRVTPKYLASVLQDTERPNSDDKLRYISFTDSQDFHFYEVMVVGLLKNFFTNPLTSSTVTYCNFLPSRPESSLIKVKLSVQVRVLEGSEGLEHHPFISLTFSHKFGRTLRACGILLYTHEGQMSCQDA